MTLMTRREFSSNSLRTLLLANLGFFAWQKRAISGPLNDELIQWIRRLDQMSADLKANVLPQREGLRILGSFFDQVSVEEFCRFIDFEKIIRGMEFPSEREFEKTFRYPKVEGIPENLHFKSQIVAMQRGKSIPPHGHNNQITGFLILNGELHGRHYDRLDESEDTFLLTPTIDKKFASGAFSMISDEKDNVHWFSALTREAFLLNLVITPLNSRPMGGRVHMDLRDGEIGDGRIRARKITGDKAYDLYWE